VLPFFVGENTHKLMGLCSVILGGRTRFLPPHPEFLEKPKFRKQRLDRKKVPKVTFFFKYNL
jgi:hypothetical protein